MGNLKCVSLREKGGSLQLLVVPACHLLEGAGWVVRPARTQQSGWGSSTHPANKGGVIALPYPRPSFSFLEIGELWEADKRLFMCLIKLSRNLSSL